MHGNFEGGEGFVGEEDEFDLNDLDEEEQDIEQREVMSKQITQILLDRVKKLEDVFQQAKNTLESDVDASTTECTAKLMRERAQSRPRHSVDVDEKQEAFTFTYQRPNPSRLFTAKQLFRDRSLSTINAISTPTLPNTSSGNQTSRLPAIQDDSISRTSSSAEISTIAKDKQTLSKLFSVKDGRERTLQERELHSIADHHVTRSVEHISFRYGEPSPFDTKRKLMMGYVQTHASLPEHENLTKTFRYVMRSALVGEIFDCLFWYNLSLHFIQPRNLAAVQLPKNRSRRNAFEQEVRHMEADLSHLRRDLSKLYIELIRMFQTIPLMKRDLIHRYTPFSVAHAILVALRYLCPGSRHLYTSSLQKQVYKTCCELLLGTQVSDISIQTIRSILFPYESRSSFVQDDSAQGQGDTGETSNQEDGPGNEGKDEMASSKNVVETEGEKDAEWDMQGSFFQPRKKYDSMKVGNLLQEFLSEGREERDIRPGTAPAHMVHRTVPCANARVGGSDTFHKTPSRENTVAKIAKKYAKEREEYLSFVQKSRTSLRTRTQAVIRRRDEILRSGVAEVQRFCLDLSQEPAYVKEDITEPNLSTEAKVKKHKIRRRRQRAAEGSISGESKGVRNKHLQGDQKVDWHANLAVHINLPPAERIIAATEKIEASKKSDRQKPRTRARIMLCGLK